MTRAERDAQKDAARRIEMAALLDLGKRARSLGRQGAESRTAAEAADLAYRRAGFRYGQAYGLRARKTAEAYVENIY